MTKEMLERIHAVNDYAPATVEIAESLALLRVLLPLGDYRKSLQEVRKLVAAGEALQNWIMDKLAQPKGDAV